MQDQSASFNSDKSFHRDEAIDYDPLDSSNTVNRKRFNNDNIENFASFSKVHCVETACNIDEDSTPKTIVDNSLQDIITDNDITVYYNSLYASSQIPNEKKNLKDYNAKNCRNMVAQMNLFLKKYNAYRINNSKSNYGERIVLLNAFNDIYIHFSLETPITLEILQELFSVSGHSFYIDLKHNYVTTLVLSLSCAACESGECALKVANEDNGKHLDHIISGIWKEILTLLGLSYLNFQQSVLVFTKANTCKMFIYINVTVSINVYTYIVNALNQSQSESMKPVLQQYKINHISYIPLPYIAKSDGDVYTLDLQWQHHRHKFNIIPCTTNYIDFKMQLLNDLNITKDIVLAKIMYNYSSEFSQHLHHDEVTQEWDITDKMKVEIVYVIIVLNEILDSNENYHANSSHQYPIFKKNANGIPSFIRSRRKFIMESINENFKLFAHNLLKESYANNDIDMINYQQKFTFVPNNATELERKILATLDSIGRNIARHVYQVEILILEPSTKHNLDYSLVDPKKSQFLPTSQQNLPSDERLSNTYSYIGYLIQFCFEPDNSAGYAFYILILSIMYTMQKLSLNSHHRDVIISMLKQVITVQKVTDNKQLLWILDSLISVNCMSELERIFPEPLRILKHLATSVFLRRRVESRLINDAVSSSSNNGSGGNGSISTRSLVSTTSISYDVLLFDELCGLYLHEELSLYTHLSDLMLEEIVTTIFRRYLKLFYRNIMTNNIMYMYKDPLYIEHKMSNFVSDNTANSKLRFMYDKLLMYIVPIVTSKSSKGNETRWRNRAMKIIKNAWYNYVNEHIPVKNVHFGKYRYFICTLRGIFNNITGLYMCGIPQLYFENASSFCVLPPIDVGDINYNTMNVITVGDDISGHNYHAHLREINDELITRISKWKEHVHIYISAQDKLFYLSIMVPGLLKIGESVFNKQTRTLIINTLTDRFCNDNNLSNQEELFYLLPVMQYHSIDCNSIIAIARCIDILMNENHVPVTAHSLTEILDTRYGNDLNNLYLQIGEKRKNWLQYERYVDANELYKDIVKPYKYHPNRLILALAFIWALIEWDNNDNDCISTLFNIQRKPYNYQILKEVINSSKLEKISITLRGDPFGLTQEKLNLRQFTCETNENFRRAFDITFQPVSSTTMTTTTNVSFDSNQNECFPLPVTVNSHHSLDTCMYNAFLSISIIFRFDSRAIIDYLEHSTLLFQPFNNCRKFTLYYGEPRCGKSFLANLIIRAAEPSVFNVLSDLTTAASAASPSPDLIKAFQSYVVCIKEVRKLAESLLKTITGEDHMDQRDLYKGYQKLTPICFIFGCTNQIPQIKADEAIKDRLSIFYFINRIEPSYNFRENIDDNQLLLYINECTIQPQIEEFATSIGLYNTIYALFCLKRNQFGYVIPTINNYASKKIMKKFLIYNSIMYNIMGDCGIDVCGGYSIKVNDLRSRAEAALKKSKRAMRYNYYLHDFMRDFNHHFRKFRIHNKLTKNDEFIGVGLPPTDTTEVNVIELIFNEVCRHIYKPSNANKNYCIYISNIRKLITLKVKAIIGTNADREADCITRILLKVKSAYHTFYNVEEQCYHNLKIREKMD